MHSKQHLHRIIYRLIINEGSSTTDINTVQFTNVKSTELRSISSEYSGDLVVRYGISDQFTINYAYTSIFEFKFSDNVTWTNADIKARAVITGTVGDDTLEGFNTNDILSGSLGNDTLYGKDGSDTYLFAKGDGIDWLSDNTGTLGTDINTVKFTDVKSTDVTSISQYYGNLIINYGVSDQLTVYGQLDGGADGNGVQVFKFSDGVNWTRAYLESQPIMSFGTSGNDILFGGSGIDNLVGGLGNDTYSVNNSGDLVTENLNEGTDSVQSIVSYTLGNNVENLTLFGVANINATGNALNNILMGNIAANILTGGAGNDTYTINDNLDTIIENLNEGIDLINSSITYSLVANVENLTLTGTTAINGTGNNLANSLTGNSANNILDGGIGIDTLKGGAGNDTYIVDNSSDIITESASAGTDLALSSATYTLSSNVENLTLTGTANINGTGNNANNMIIGNAGNNTLNGSTGNDTLMGGLGDDIFRIDNAADVTNEAVNEGTDTIEIEATYNPGTYTLGRLKNCACVLKPAKRYLPLTLIPALQPFKNGSKGKNTLTAHRLNC